MIRAGLIRRITAGAYVYLPMGYRALRKAEAIVREEMIRAGSVELLMPALQPPELWKRTGRYDDMGKVLIKYKDRHGKEMLLGPTHEEIITDIVSKEIRSYKDLPVRLFQIQTKFRDEVRPRFGVVRSCEFIMKDAYSFDADPAAMEKSYKAMYDAYCRIFERCNLPYIAVEADPGLMGGTVSHEFMVPSEIGEDRIAVCTSCGYAASVEVASVGAGKTAAATVRPEKMAEVATPGVSTVKEVSAFLKVSPSDMIKTLIYLADGEPVAVLVLGSHTANETKIKNCLKAGTLELADEDKIQELTGSSVGFSGPVGLSLKIVADNAVRDLVNAVTGANKDHRHLRNVNPGRDFKVNKWADIRVITETDSCPRCDAGIELKNAIEVGHTFKLGTRYSEPLGANVLDENGKQRFVTMGCYGIGINRILAAMIETSHDKDGIIWTPALSPCEVVVIIVKAGDSQMQDAAEKIYTELGKAGIDAILDDRTKSAGVKFKDADLVGFPVQVIIGAKSLEEGKVEVKERSTGEKTFLKKEDLIERLRHMLKR